MPGATSVQLFWTEPDNGGHPGPLTSYVVYRPVGATDWTNGPGELSGRTTFIPDLACGVTYEFGVISTSADGATSEVAGTTAAAPTEPCPPPTTSTTTTSTTTIPTPTPPPLPTPAAPVTVTPAYTG